MEGARPATSEDVPRIAELVAAAVAELTPMKGGVVWAAREASWPPHEARLLEALADPARLVLAGTIDDAVIGYAVTHVEDLRDGSRLGVIDDLFVEEGARGVGVGEAMMQSVLAWLDAQGCAGADAMALPGHRAAKNFFEGSGFTARQIVMHHRMDAG